MTTTREMMLQEPYQPRAIRFLTQWREGEWTMKVYGIRYGGERPDAAILEAAERLARRRLAETDPAEGYGVGFIGVHQGRDSIFVFVDWWTNENELRHDVHCTDGLDLQTLGPASPDRAMACVWDLRVMQFEREAWLETVLANPQGPDLDAYLGRHLNGDF